MIVAIVIIGIIIASVYLIQQANNSDRKIFRFYFIPILLGLVFEFKRLSEKWSTVLWTAVGSYVFSLFAFLKGKSETTYIFEEHLEMWPYYFIGTFIFIAMIVNIESATRKLTEGITLLLTIAINYWILEKNYWEDSVFVKCLIVANILLSIFSIYNALSYSRLNKGVRLILSLWSSIITLILAADNFLTLYNYRDIENLPATADKILVFLEFFLLGISSIYIAQNLIMLTTYLPGKNYMQTIRDMNEVHLNRFSKEQVNIFDSIIVIIFSLAGFILNYFFQFFPPNSMIWAMIVIAPFLLYLIHRVLNR